MTTRKKAAFTLALLTLALLAAEGVAQLVAFRPAVTEFRARRGLEGNRVHYGPDSFCGYRLTKGPLVNSLGFQGPEPGPKTKPRVAWLGGSTSTGYPQLDEPGWPTLAFREIAEVEFLNAGTCGYTSMESVTSLATRLASWRPDVVFVFDGYNDVSVACSPGFRHDYSHVRRGTDCRPLWIDSLPAATWSSQLAVRLGSAFEKFELEARARRGEGSAPWVGGTFDPRGAETFAANLELLRRLAQGRLVVVTQTYNRPGVAQGSGQQIGLAAMNETARRFALESGVTLVDADATPPPWSDFTDACHLVNGDARQRYATRMLPLIRAALEPQERKKS